MSVRAIDGSRILPLTRAHDPAQSHPDPRRRAALPAPSRPARSSRWSASSRAISRRRRQTIALLVGRLRAALRLHPADPRARRRCARQGAGHEGLPRRAPAGAGRVRSSRPIPTRSSCLRDRRGRGRRRRRAALARADRRPGRDGERARWRSAAILVAVIIGQLAGSSLAGLHGRLGRLARRLRRLDRADGARARAPPSSGSAAPPRRRQVRSRAGARRAIARSSPIRGRCALFAFVFVEAIAIFGVFPYVAPLLEERGGGRRDAGRAGARRLRHRRPRSIRLW